MAGVTETTYMSRERNASSMLYASWKPQPLKRTFTSAPILQHPDSEKTFIMEVDASDTGVGAILSQHFGESLKMHPLAFYS